ncbi:type II toxin-antitoxin system antitoxin DNA ADP-ribosyl glycohydrolase DarG [Methylorubrum salsuginis]|uniref:O-acetyl-ADP-ribose deacetylase (Regulator of RNase III), contains Macro domain n=1 Tax=Methylorubrum salsuginis TaxID=414703 RepID=A0A1I4D0J5_9HYPH|nr:macro domain-containing protein [Methylorubrum salsuginis]SFK86390.1 O-acetyl-ADP-ribose deacetylase (regulator of RNase III), contains Macro domain [Methylorubrum salsuginis]
MITFTQGDLLDAPAEALVNTVNTVGVMGKGIALMFKEHFPENFRAYAAACKAGEVQTGRMFVTERGHLTGPRWIINFPTKANWRFPSKMIWIEEGLADLRRVIEAHGIRSIAVPPLGSGNGGLNWEDVRPRIEAALGNLPDVEVIVYEPTTAYQNVSKRSGKKSLTPARALVVELVRRYAVLGFECSLLEVQKLAYLLESEIEMASISNPLKLAFKAHRYGPYADRLRHLLDGIDGTYLHCEKRLADAGPLDIVRFEDSQRDRVATYLKSEGKDYIDVLEATASLIDGFESPYGMELLATVHWLMHRGGFRPEVEAIMHGIKTWPGGSGSAARKARIFDERVVRLAVERLSSHKEPRAS